MTETTMVSSGIGFLPEIASFRSAGRSWGYRGSSSIDSAGNDSSPGSRLPRRGEKAGLRVVQGEHRPGGRQNPLEDGDALPDRLRALGQDRRSGGVPGIASKTVDDQDAGLPDPLGIVQAIEQGEPEPSSSTTPLSAIARRIWCLERLFQGNISVFLPRRSKDPSRAIETRRPGRPSSRAPAVSL
ncbi:MAG: hypothetical protein MZU97_12355 [Bacillus subtilis]|nr:hypothetical protein [Bacillus subtilis]